MTMARAAYDKEPHLAYNGCGWHDDCFTCPFPDCKANTNMGMKKSRPVSANHESGKEKETTDSLQQREGKSQDG
jgi:hypothetical protein